ncbi:thioesterase family protein [Microbacterium sp. RD1]|uniref:thioesterase family protein n=1 Tax=Microbacterium sp. RD1 TaxID=3457313 RepID=UPI003FA5B9E0
MESAYFERLDASRFRATPAVGGAWRTDEQHIAPSFGLLTHVLETDHRARQSAPFEVARISFDILGVLPIDVVETAVRVVRPGRTIELAEATLSHGGRAAVIARAWFLATPDTASVAGSAFPLLPPRAELEPWDASTVWPGECVRTVEIRRDDVEPGRARYWMRPRIPLLGGEPVSPTARLVGMVDVANGSATRVSPTEWAFPNVDLSVQLFRTPTREWTGFDTTVSFGPHGHGLTHSILHDEDGPLGAVEQTLTLRSVGVESPT